MASSYRGEQLTLRDVLATPGFQGTEVLAGASGLDGIVSSVNIMENPSITPWVKSRELLITVGYSLAAGNRDLAALIEELADLDLAGFGVKLGPYINEIGADALDAARRRGLPILSLPAAVSFDDLIADVYRARGSLLLGGLHRKSDREQELMRVALAGGGPVEVAARLADLTGCEVVVLGPGNDVLAHHASNDGVLDEIGNPPAGRRFEGAAAAPIVFGSTYVGHLYVFPKQGPIASFFPGLVPTSAQIMALAASREIAVASVDRQFRAEFLEQLLESRLDDRDVRRRCQARDWNISYPSVVVNLKPVTLDATPYLERARDALGWSLKARGLHAPHAIVNGEVVAIVGSGGSAAGDPETTAVEAADEAMARLVRRTWSVGISAEVDDSSGLWKGWEQARTATRVANVVRGPGGVTRFTDLGVFRLLSEVDAGVLQTFAREALGELYEPSGDRAELRRTLEVLLETNLNVAETARIQHYHYNTIRNRATQLERLVGPFSTDATRRLELQVALLIGEMHAPT